MFFYTKPVRNLYVASARLRNFGRMAVRKCTIDLLTTTGLIYCNQQMCVMIYTCQPMKYALINVCG